MIGLDIPWSFDVSMRPENVSQVWIFERQYGLDL